MIQAQFAIDALEVIATGVMYGLLVTLCPRIVFRMKVSIKE